MPVDYIRLGKRSGRDCKMLIVTVTSGYRRSSAVRFGVDVKGGVCICGPVI